MKRFLSDTNIDVSVHIDEDFHVCTSHSTNAFTYMYVQSLTPAHFRGIDYIRVT
jgi:hypothetical protein